MEIKPPVSRKFRVAITLMTVMLAGLFFSQTGKINTGRIGQAAITNQPGLYRVAKVLDGDTIEVQIANTKETVRLIGVDTPETHDPRKPVQCFGQAAANFSQNLMLGKKVRLEADPNDSNRDKYQRLLRYVYLTDGSLVNAELIKQGYGFVYIVFPYEKIDQFRQYEYEARSAGRGLWAGCTIDESTRVKQTNPQ